MQLKSGGKGDCEMLTTPDVIRTLPRKLYTKAKQEPAYRFYARVTRYPPVVDQRHMPEATAVFPQHAAAIGRVHQVIAVGYALRRH